MTTQSPLSQIKKLANNLKYSAEGLATEVSAVGRGLIPVLRSDIVAKGGGVRGKLTLLEGIARYGFSTARQMRYAAFHAPDQLAFIDDMGQRTYGEMLDDVQALARALQRRGVGKGSRVGVMCRNSRAIIYALGAKGFVGAKIFLLNIGSSPEQLANSLAEHDLDLLIIDEEFAERLPEDLGGCEIIIGHAEDLSSPQVRDASWPTFQQVIDSAPGEQEEKLPLFPKRDRIIIMSSGTSGTPKGVSIQDPLIPTPLVTLVTKVPWRKHMMVQMSASMFHAWGWGNINLIIAHRATVVLRRVFDPKQAMEDLVNYQVEGIISSPIFLKEQLRVAVEGDYDVSNVKMIFSSGHAISPELIDGIHEKFGPILANYYGSTEASSCVIATGEDLAKDPAVSGRPVAGVRIKILDEDGKELPPGQVGRIFCRGRLTMKEYTNDRDKMVIEKGLLEIGDKGYLTEDGRLYVLGRNDDMIIVGGENVYPKSVSEALEPMPGIRDLFVKGVEDEETFARLAVWIVREDDETGRSLTKKGVQDWVRDKLAEHSVPRDVVFVDELPYNPTGKVMPRQLPDSRIHGEP